PGRAKGPRTTAWPVLPTLLPALPTASPAGAPAPTPTHTAMPTPTPSALATATPTPTPAPTLSRVSAFGGKWFLLGYDYPWKDYSYDFSTTSNISPNYSAISSQFADMAANGTHVTRWCVFNKGSQALSFNSSGWISGLKTNHAFYQD